MSEPDPSLKSLSVAELQQTISVLQDELKRDDVSTGVRIALQTVLQQCQNILNQRIQIGCRV